MGLVSGLLTLPLAPARGVGWLAEHVVEVGEREYYDPARIRAELQALARALEEGEITPEEFDAEEDKLLDRLEEAQWRVSVTG
ncbi:gas vesicle protein GvpG [Actinopolymorpha pittospori]|uniref:Gas vesicle protein G n=1 Tax=Actinopolymorpha pittospori TaxID=648752 RepID=A0A927MVT6_9ACTN|nr:hypothetical protein [Actinopolymorpha pittospori]